MGFADSALSEWMSAGKAPVDEDHKYGVFLDEQATLASVVDNYDMSPDDGPQPAIADALPGMIPYDVVEHPDGDIVLNHMAYDIVAPGNTVVIYGPRRSGKSHFIKALCQRLRPYYPDVLVFTSTKASCEYHGFVPDTCIINGLDEDLLDLVMSKQEEKNMAASRGIYQGNYNILVILDDCMSEKLRFKDIFNRVFFNGRHYNMTLICTLQDVKGVAPAASLNTDVAFSFPIRDRRGTDTIREKFCDYLTRHQFETLLDSEAVNKKFHLIGYDIKHKYNNASQRLMIGCVDPDTSEKYVMGCRELWKYDLQQLQDLGFGHLIHTEDWGIEQPTQAKQQEKAKKNINKNGKRSRDWEQEMPAAKKAMLRAESLKGKLSGKRGREYEEEMPKKKKSRQ